MHFRMGMAQPSRRTLRSRAIMNRTMGRDRFLYMDRNIPTPPRTCGHEAGAISILLMGMPIRP
jgi:hypothetical protein